MARRETVPVTKNLIENSHHGAGATRESHPAYGSIRVNRREGSGDVLFDSDIRHNRTVMVTLSRMEVERDLKRDWHHEREQLFEVQMSEAQWGAFVSSFGQGTGVPCTIRATPDDHGVPGLPYEPRLAVSVEETKNATREAFAGIKRAVERLQSLDQAKAGVKARRDAIAAVLRAVDVAPRNVEFASNSLVEHTENVVTKAKAKADIEAMVLSAAQGYGAQAITAGSPLAITGDVIDAEEAQD